MSDREHGPLRTPSGLRRAAGAAAVGGSAGRGWPDAGTPAGHGLHAAGQARPGKGSSLISQEEDIGLILGLIRPFGKEIHCKMDGGIQNLSRVSAESHDHQPLCNCSWCE